MAVDIQCVLRHSGHRRTVLLQIGESAAVKPQRVRPHITRVNGLQALRAELAHRPVAEIYFLIWARRLGRLSEGTATASFSRQAQSENRVQLQSPRGAEEKIYALISDICVTRRRPTPRHADLISNRLKFTWSNDRRFTTKFRRTWSRSCRTRTDAVNAAALSSSSFKWQTARLWRGAKVHRIHDRNRRFGGYHRSRHGNRSLWLSGLITTATHQGEV